MICLILLVIFALPCSAVDTSHGSVGDQAEVPPANVVDRYLNLHKQLYDSTKILSVESLKEILEEMFSIEQTLEYQGSLKSSNDLINHRHRDLVSKFINAKLLVNKNATVTELLLQTFEHGSNDCNAEYFSQLNEIYKEFKSYSAITKTLQKNRELQEKNCWTRFMDSLSRLTMLLGTRARTSLNQFISLVYVDLNKEVVLMHSNEMEHTRIARRVRLLLDSGQDFRNLVEHPCKVLIETTKHLMYHINALLRYIGNNRRSFITNNHKLVLNRYMMCRLIIADLKPNLPSDQLALSDDDDESEEDELPDVSTELTLGLGMNEGTANLITQTLPINSDIDTLQSDNIEFPTTKQSKPIIGVKRPRSAIEKSSDDSNFNLEPGSAVNKVIRIDRGIGRSNKITYPTHWSDGTISVEKRQFLASRWPDAWKQQNELQHLVNRARLEARVRDRLSSRGQLNPRPISNDKTVTNIENGVGRGENIVYPTHWSDGTKTDEKKEYLAVHWPIAWMAHERNKKSERQARYMAKKKAKKQSKPSPENE